MGDGPVKPVEMIERMRRLRAACLTPGHSGAVARSAGKTDRSRFGV
jgi:hypothetical protein